jgi:hypothetical protein
MHEVTSATESDYLALKRQLGAPATGFVSILERCSHGYPAVIMVAPDEADEAEQVMGGLSNFIWLTCPYMNKKIHDLESKGYIGKISSFINSDKSIMQLMKEAHVGYHFMRKRLCRGLRDAIRGTDAGSAPMLKTGIGGILNPEHLKCLHLHYAHYRICDKNIAGRMVLLLLDGVNSCEEVRCAHGS